ncbi:MAG: metal-dependent transcriptional regulator [Deltaproteobacteria bacterium]|jgi:DtxR family transcriptional regulator, Mn-dependent transcriptional regulator|nr:metal-dependent transcriptional regulator [Deltaproteobacteria bacterium]
MPELSASQEDYLEAIYEIAGDNGVARVRDIAKHQNVSMASVNGAMKRLVKYELINHGRYDYIELTDKGKKRAAKVAKCHALLKKFLVDVLGVDKNTADKDACAIEHHLSEITVKKLITFLDRGTHG